MPNTYGDLTAKQWRKWAAFMLETAAPLVLTHSNVVSWSYTTVTTHFADGDDQEGSESDRVLYACFIAAVLDDPSDEFPFPGEAVASDRLTAGWIA